MSFFDRLSPVFYMLIYMSITACAGGFAVCIFRRLSKGKLRTFLAPVLWGLVLCALIVPIVSQSEITAVKKLNILTAMPFANDLEEAERTYYQTLQDVLTNNEYTNEQSAALKRMESNLEEKRSLVILFNRMIPAVWFIGVAVAAIVAACKFCWLYFARRRVAGNAVAKKTRLYRLAEKAGKDIKFGCDKPVAVVEMTYSHAVRLRGYVQPVLTVGTSQLRRTDEELINRFHKLLMRHAVDVYILERLLAALKAVYWFNPILVRQLSLAGADIYRSRDIFVENPPAGAYKIKTSWSKVKAALSRFARKTGIAAIYRFIVSIPIHIARLIKFVLKFLFAVLKTIITILKRTPGVIAREGEGIILEPIKTLKRWGRGIAGIFKSLAGRIKSFF